MAYYRKYRPQIIDEIDNASVRAQLLALLSKDRKELPHAYFFTGPKGTGKTTAARVIAKLFNCEKSTKSGPCGSCEQCTGIANGTSLDVIEMDAASNRGIDEIRQLRERIGLSPVSSAYTVYIIDEVHMLTTEAFNALLKTLEEPPSHAVFVLATTDAHKVPPTITSRCMVVKFAKASKEELLHALERVVKSEKISISDEALQRIIEVADGAFRDAVKFLEQVSFGKGKIEIAHIDSVLSLSTSHNVALFVSLLYGKEADVAKALAHIHAAVSEGADIRSLLTDVLQYLHKELVVRVSEKNTTHDTKKIERMIHVLTRAYGELRYSPIPELPLELAVIELSQDPLPNIAVPITVPVSTPPPKISTPQVVSSVAIKPVAPVGEVAPAAPTARADGSADGSLGLLTQEKLVEHWSDFIAATKPYNHSVAGVLRSSRPKSVNGGIVTIEAFYTFHQEKLADIHTKQVLSDVLKKLFGEKVKIEIVLGKK